MGELSFKNPKNIMKNLSFENLLNNAAVTSNHER